MFGEAANISTYLGNKKDTNLSSLNLVEIYTTNYIASARLINHLYTNKNKLFITGYVQWADAPGDIYGIGGDTSDNNVTEAEGIFKKNNQNILFNVWDKLYIGPQFTLIYRYKEDFKKNNQKVDFYEYGVNTEDPFTLFGGGFRVGTRLKLNKKSRTNIAFDVGVGKEGSHGFYFRLIEAF
jgi:hypothetical protein